MDIRIRADEPIRVDGGLLEGGEEACGSPTESDDEGG